MFSATRLMGVLEQDLSNLSHALTQLANVLPPAAIGTEYSVTLKNGKKVTIVIGDITKQNVDAIVNASNEQLKYGGGVAGAIYNAAAPHSNLQQKTLNELYPAGCKTGGACLTIAFGGLRDRGIRFVIEAVGPICATQNKPSEAEENLIDAAYRAVFSQITEFNINALQPVLDKISQLQVQKTINDSLKPIQSVAMPIISAALFGCGEENVIPRAVKVLYDTMSTLRADNPLNQAVLMVYVPGDMAKSQEYFARARDRLKALELIDE